VVLKGRYWTHYVTAVLGIELAAEVAERSASLGDPWRRYDIGDHVDRIDITDKAIRPDDIMRVGFCWIP